MLSPMFWHDRRMLRLGVVFAVGACGFSPRSATPIDGSPIDTSSPDGVMADAGGCGALEIAAGGEHTCARTNDGSLYCWGRGANGELGISPLGYKCMVGGAGYYCSPSPSRVQLAAPTALGLGALHTCATTATETYCWGVNLQGQYGDGTISGQSVPRAIAQRAGATLVAGGAAHTCSIAGGSVSCSGQNVAGEVGNGAAGMTTTATAVLASATSLGIGDYTTCAVDSQQQVQCWGRNASRQIDPTLQNKLVPTIVTGVDMAIQVVAGRDHICAVRSDHSALCWGANAQSQLGDGTSSAFFYPPQAVPLPNVVELAAERFHTCARDTDGAVWCWGEGYTPAPSKIALARPATAITAGSVHDCAITDDQRVWCWGNQDFGQLGNGVNTSTRVLDPQQATTCP